MDAHVLLASFRDELSTLDTRRADLREQLEVLDRDHERLETTIAVLSERVGVAAGAGSADEPESVPLTDRIVDALGANGLSRREMLRLFVPQGFTPSAIDSAANRLVKRGAVRRQGGRIVSVVPLSGGAEPVASDSVGVFPSSAVEPAVGDSGDVEDHESGADPHSVDSGPDKPVVSDMAGESVDDDGRPLTRRVLDAVQAGAATRQEVLEYFRARGVTGNGPVNRAIWGLRKRGALTEVAGRLAVAVVGDGNPSGLNPGSLSRL